MSSTTPITPNRHTRLILDVASPIATRPPWSLRRFAGQISRGRTAANVTSQVSLQPGGGWTLSPLLEDASRLITTTWEPQALGAAEVTLGSSWEAVDTYKKPTEPGLGVSGSVISSGLPGFTKRVTAGADWNSNLGADSTAFPKPTLLSDDIPMDRVLVSKGTYHANSGWLVGVMIPGGLPGPDTILTFYFGGPADVYPSTAKGGEFAFSLRGNGVALLDERNAAGAWVRRKEWSAFDPNFQGNLAQLYIKIWPYDRHTIAFSVMGADGVWAPGAGFTLSGLLITTAGILAGQGAATPHRTFYRTSPLGAGYEPGHYVTGAGPVRLDVRRDLRTICQIIHLKPPATGTLVDLPFWVPYPFPAGTLITVRAHGYAVEDTGIASKVYNAATNVLLTEVGSGTGIFQSHANQQAYYARFNLTADADQQQTPVLHGYTLDVAGAVSSLAPVQVTGGNIRQVSVTGPDTDPSQDTASLEITDPNNALGLLRVRARIPAQIAIYDDASALTTVLFQGEVAQASAKHKGKSGRTWPVANWHEYSCSMVGMWARMAEFVPTDLQDFSQDPLVPPGPGAVAVPWKITEIIREIFRRMGFVAAQLDIPNLDIRLWVGRGETEADFTVQPGANVAEFLLTLAKDYLGMILLWDPNAGVAGMWRLRYNPAAPYVPIATFRASPVAAGRIPTHPNSYAVGETFIEDGTYVSHVRPPECNFVLVYGAGGQLPDGGPTAMAYSMYNPVSYDFNGATSNPLDPDYLGRIVPVVHVDSALGTPQAVAWVCRRIYDVAAHAQKWVQWTSPLLLVSSALTGDALQVRSRALRIGDVVTVQKAAGLGSASVILRSVNPMYSDDGIQRAHYEGLQVT